jgi:nucleotide-binding universal stress UspA family protein
MNAMNAAVISVESQKTPSLRTMKTLIHSASQTPAARPETHSGRRILVVVEPATDSRKLVQYAATLARREQASVCLLHVVDCGSFVSGLAESVLIKPPDHLAKVAHRYLRLLARRELPADVPVRLLVQQGKTAREVVKAAESICADLILIASPRQNWLSRWFSSDPTRWIEAHAPCSVVVVRESSYGTCDCMTGFEIGRATAIPS